MKPLITLLFTLLALGMAPAQAHKPSDSYLTLHINTGEPITGQWDIALRDLEAAVGLDHDGDARIRWGEVLDAQAAITRYAFSRLRIESAESPCPLQLNDLLIDEHVDGPYAVLQFASACKANDAADLRLRYQLLFDIDPSHRGLIQVTQNGDRRIAVLSPDSPAMILTGDQATNASLIGKIMTFVWQGMWHIWIGIDHLLFLACLLLPAVMRPATRHWVGVDSLGQALRPLLIIVTAFTLAHSLTLSLAVLDFVQLPSRWVESGIAASIIVVALLNLSPALRSRWRHDRWVVAFAFGLLHGFGFAGVLQALGLPADSLAAALISFNVGVELGQLAAIALAFPLAYALRNTRLYSTWILGGGSIAIIILASIWVYERLLSLP